MSRLRWINNPQLLGSKTTSNSSR